MSLSNEQIVEAIAEKKLSEVVELIELIETRFGVSSAAVAMTAAPAASVAVEEEKTEFDVVMKGLEDSQKRMAVIRALRAALGSDLSLGAAKGMVDEVEKKPVTLKTGIAKELAQEIKKTLSEAGALVDVV